MNSNIQTCKYQSGYTLVELLVGAFIGLFLVIGMGQMYLSGKQTYNVSQSVGRAQEDLRFAYHFITRDLRESSFTNCLRNVRNMVAGGGNNLNNLNIKVGGWDHTGTSPGDNITLDTNYAVSTSRGDWDGLDVGGTDLPNFIESVPNSDVLMIRTITPLDGAIVSASVGTPNMTITGLTTSVAEDDVLVVGNCRVADQFVASSATSGTSVVSSTNTFREDWGPESRVSHISNTFYYIGLRDGAETPSLFRITPDLPGADVGQPQELVEGVESIQVLFGIDLNNSGDANRYVSASDVNDWTQVVATRIGLLLVQSDGRAASVASNESITYSITDGVNFVTDTSSGDTGLRFGSTSTVKTRNLGVTPAFILTVCNAGSSPTCDTNGFTSG